MKDKPIPKSVSAYMRSLAKKTNEKIASTPEARERARARAAKAREALKRKREARKVIVAPAVPSATNPPVWSAQFEPKEAGK
jgi:hypothetical protein